MLRTFRGPSPKPLIGLATLSVCTTAFGGAPASASASTVAPTFGERDGRAYGGTTSTAPPEAVSIPSTGSTTLVKEYGAPGR
jgi:hypothetical protein